MFVGALLFFGRARLAALWSESQPISRPFLLLHGLALVAIAALSFLLLQVVPNPSPAYNAAVVGWFAAILLLVGTLPLTLFPVGRLRAAAIGLGSAWVYAAITTALAMLARTLVHIAWDAPGSRFGAMLQASTFNGVRVLLQLFYTGVVANAATLELGTARVTVEVAGGCSGIEGLTLMLALSVGWLVFARRELRMARAVWLVPISLAAVWVLNLVRIAALIAIGDAGYEAVAVGGFHSEAGWILFNVVALGFLLAAQRLRWLRKISEPAEASAGMNPTAIYLSPFLAILAASLLTQAVSSGFEWLYALRLVVALAVLWWFRATYRRMDFRFGWLGIVAGAAVFAMWALLARGAGGGEKIAAGLALLTPLERVLWLSGRVLAAVVTVPLAEELAFRGYVARRVMDEDFERVPYTSLNFVAILISAVLFGAMHGRMWLAGIVAGIVFAVVARVRGRLGEAVAAHAVANLGIAVWVLVRGDYAMW